MTVSRIRRWFLPVLVLLATVRCGGGDGLTLPDDGVPTAIVRVSGDAQTGVVGQRLTDTLVVRLTDSKNRPTVARKVVFQAVAGGTGAVLIPDTAITDGDGQARSVWVLGSLVGAQRVEARVIDPGVTGTLKTAFTAAALADQPDTTFALAGNNQSGTVGSVLAIPLTVVVTDRFGNPVAGLTVTWNVPVGQGSVSATTSVTAADGQASVTRTLGASSGVQTTSATVAGVPGSPVVFSHTALAGGATRLVKILGDNRVAPAGFQDSIVVRLEDTNGNGVANGSITWAPAQGGSAAPTLSQTDADGYAFTFWSLGPAVGTQSITAIAAPSGFQVTFNATATASQPTTIARASGIPASYTATVGQAVGPAPSVIVTDQNNNPVQGVNVDFVVTGGNGQVSNGLVTGGIVTILTNPSGIATLTSWTLGPLVGANSLEARAVDAASAPLGGSPIGWSATGQAGSAAQVVITTQPSTSGQSGIVLAQQPVLQLRDAFGNAVGQSAVQVTAAVVGGGAQLRGSVTVVTNASGVASFSGLNLVGPIGSYSLGFTSGPLIGDSSTAIALAAGSAAKLSLVTQPSASAQSGVPFAVQPALQVQDSAGNPVGTVINVTATIATGAGALGGTISVATLPNGTVAFTDLSITGASGPRTLSFSAAGLASAVSGTVTVGAGVATQLGVLVQPSTGAQSGSALAQQPQVELRDATGNPVFQTGVSVTATLTGAPAGVVLGGTATIQTSASGVASFVGLSLTGPAGSYTLSFASTGLIGATSTAIQLQAGLATKVVLVAQPPAAGQSSVVLVPAPVLQLQDATGNSVAQQNVAITASISSGPGGSLGGTITVPTAANGSVTFSNLAINGPVGSYTLTFGGSGLTSAVSTGIVLSAGPAAALALSTAPDAAPQSGVAFAAQPQVQLVDGAGNPVAVSGTSVAATILSGPAGGTLTSASATTGGGGLASFSGLTLTGTVGSYTLQFAASGVTPVATGTLVLSAGAPVSIVKTAGDNQTGTVGSTLPVNPTVLVTDARGNPVPGASVTFAVTSALGGSVGSPTTITDLAGLASTSWTLRALLGINTISATSSAGAVGFTATGLPGLAGKLSIITQPAASVASGAVFPQQPVIQLQDLLGNPVTTSGVAITATASTGTLQGTTTVVSANGVATFTNLSLTGPAGSYTLTFSGSGLSGVTSNAITLGAGTAARLVVTTAPSATAASGAQFAVQPVIEVQDASGNPVSGARNVSALVAGGTLTGTNPVSTGSGSSAAFTNLAITSGAGAKTLTFTSGSLTPDSAVVTITAGGPASVTANSTTSQSATVGTAVGTPPSVLVRDGASNPVAGATVTFLVTAGGGSLVGGSQVTDGAGVASLTSWTLGTTSGGNTLTATVTGSGISGNPVSFAATGTAGPAAIVALNGGNGQSATVNTSVAIAPSAKVTDVNGNVVAGTLVTFAVTGGGGSLTGASATSNTQGIATVGSWTLGTAAGSNALSATATGLTGSPVGFTATGTAGAAAKLTKSAGDNQSAAVSTAVGIAPQVLVVDAFDNPKSGASVTFAPVAGSGSVTGGITTTNISGLATVGSWTLGASAGTNSLTATASGTGIIGNPATFTATGTAGGAASVTANSVTTQSATVGTAVATPPSVLVKDALNNPVAGATVTFAITVGTPGSLVGGTQTTDAAGIATVTSWTLDTTARANNTVTATVTGSGISGNPVSFTATGLASTAAKLVMNRQPTATVQSGVLFPTTPRVQVADQFNNAVATPSPFVVISASILTSPGGTPTITPLTATTSSTGLATFTGFTLTGPVGSYSFQFDATANGLGTVSSNTITLTPGLATALSITTQPPASSTTGAVLSPAPTVQLIDGAGNAVSQSGVAITAAVASGPGGSSLPGTNVVTTSSTGLATFSNLILSGSSGSYTLSFTGTTQPAVTSSTIVLGAGGATKLAIATQPSSSVANGAVFAQQPVIQLQDGSSNPVSQAGVTVFVNLSGGGTLGGTNSAVTNGSGQATFSGLSITGLAGARTLSFSSGALTGTTSSSINLTVGPPVLIAISAGNGQSALAGSAVATAPAVLLTDVSGQPVSGVSVTFAVASGGGSLSGSPAISNGSGVATLGSWTLGATVGGNSLTATATGSGISGNPITFTATGTAGPATQLLMVTQPSSGATNGVTFAQQPSARLADQFGNTVSTSGTAVSVAIASGGGSLGGTTTVNTSAGVATFSGLSITGLVGGHTLTFTSSGLTAATSNTITLSAGAATTIALSTGDGQTATVGTAVSTNPAVLVTDISGNPVSGVGVTFAVTGGGGSVSGGAATTNGSGIATVGSWTLGNAVGSNSLSATASGSGIAGNPITFTATGAAGAPATIALSAGDGQTTTVGTAVGTNPAVLVTDIGGNPVSGVSVTFAVTSGGGSVSGGAATTNSSGIATVGSWTLGTTAGANSLNATSGSLSGSPVTFAATGVAGSADHLAFTVQPSMTQNTQIITPAVEVSVLDQFNNLVTGATDAITLTITIDPSSGATLSGTIPVNAVGGVATFSDLSIDLSGNGFQLGASAAGLAGDTSALFHIN